LSTGYLAAAKLAGQVFERSVKRPSFGAAGTVFAFGIGSTAFSDHVPLDEICLYLFGRDCFNHLSACELDCFRLAVEHRDNGVTQCALSSSFARGLSLCLR
jgi:hypothetical protein